MLVREEIQDLFVIGARVRSGGDGAEFAITGFTDAAVQFRRVATGTSGALDYAKLALVIRHFSAVDGKRIGGSVREILKQNGTDETSAEVYLYGFAREYLKRKQAHPDNLTFREELEREIRASSFLADDELRKRLAAAPKMPRKMTVRRTEYGRNPDVIVLRRRFANGLCEQCKTPAPFRCRKDNEPYLEVHHVKPLADGGEDTLENTIALCPNCHRENHYG